jgi:hypothetical protein
MDAEATGTPDPLAWFDAGYLAATYQQAGIDPGFGVSKRIGGGTQKIAGYAWVAKAIALDDDNASMHLAAALITADHREAPFDAHIGKALASKSLATSKGSQSLLTWIAQIRGTTVEDLRARHVARGNGG